MHEAAGDGQRRRLAEGAAATRVRARRDVPGGAAPSKRFLDERLADPAEGREGAWRAEPRLISAKTLLSEVKGVGFQAHKHRR